MASSSDDPTDLISFFTPEELWEDLIEDWPNQKGKPHARRLILSGVPSAQTQAELWRAALVDGGSEDETSYEAAASAAATLRERLEWDWDGNVRRSQPRLDELAVVTADVPRTLPEKQRAGELDAAALTKVLDAFVASGVELEKLLEEGASEQGSSGYTQGLADVAAWLLMHGLPPWQAYAVLHAQQKRPLLRSVMALDQNCWNALCDCFEAHLKSGACGEVGRSLSAHLEGCGLVPFFFLPEWLVALWTRSLSDGAARSAWNLLLVDGELCFLLAAPLGVLCAIASKLMSCRDLVEARNTCRDAPKELSVEEFQSAALGVALDNGLLQRHMAQWVPDVPAAPRPAQEAIEGDASIPPPPPEGFVGVYPRVHLADVD